MTFGAIVLFGTMISLVVLGKHGVLSDDPSSRGQQVGQGLGIVGLIGAAIAYVIQRRRADPQRR